MGAAPGSDGADAGGPVWEPPSVAAKDSDESSLMPLDPVDEEEEDEVPAGDSKAGQDAEGGAPARFWWSGMFVRAGRMGSTRHELHSKKVTAASAAAGDSGTAIKITGFSEQDQENLYTQVRGVRRCGGGRTGDVSSTCCVSGLSAMHQGRWSHNAQAMREVA